MSNSNSDWDLMRRVKALRAKLREGYTLEQAQQELDDREHLVELEE